MRALGVRSVVATLALATCVSCSGASIPSLPPIEIPSFDPDAIAQMVGDAADQVRSDVRAALPSIPADVLATMQGFGIDQVPVPDNATEICDALGTPSPDNLAAGGLVAVIRALAGDVSMALGVLVSVIFGTCESWAPYVDSALGEFFTNQ